MSDGVDFTFPGGTILPAGGFAVIARYPAIFSSTYPWAGAVYGPFLNDTKLKNSGEHVAISNSSNVVSEITYDDKSPWSTEPDGDGVSLELLHPLLNLNNAKSWAASTVAGGTPGDTNSIYLGESAIVEINVSPERILGGQPAQVTARVVSPTSVVSLIIYYSTNKVDAFSVTMFDDGAHNDGSAGDNVFGAEVPGLSDSTYVYYYFSLQLADGKTIEYPTGDSIPISTPSMTARLSYSGLQTDVVPTKDWQVATTTGQATSSRLYIYLNAGGEILIDDISITLAGTNHIPNGTFDMNDSGWSKTGTHGGSYHESSLGHSSSGCMHLVATSSGGSSADSLNRYTSPDLTEAGPVYTFSFAYRAITTNARDWLVYYIGHTNWHDIHINEVMALNNSTLADENSEYPDWIELYNAGTNPLNLYGCGLSDDVNDLIRWEFPGRIIQPNEFLIVFASDKNRKTGELHSNFKIDSQGETLTLTSRDGKVIDSFQTGQLPADTSRGCYPDGIASNVYFTDTTPGYSNTSQWYAAIAETPVFSRSGGFFQGSLSVTLSVSSAGATIRYTLDGSVPTEFSSAYSAPIPLSGNTIISAKAYETGLLPGFVESHAYYSGLPAILTSTHLPIVVIDTDGVSIPKDPKISARMGVIDHGEGNTNHITDPFNHYDGHIGIERRGKSSDDLYDKKQFGIETRNSDGEDLDIPLLGFPAESDWVLYGPYGDKTMIRNFLAYYLANAMGEYATRTRYCEVILNGDYHGVYILFEKIKRGADRVDIARLSSYENSGIDITGGYIIKIDKTDPGDNIFYTAAGTQLIQVYPKGDDITPQQADWIKDYMDLFESALAGPDSANPVIGYAKYIDVDSFINYYLVNEGLRNVDGGGFSTYLHKGRDGKLTFGPAWDFNISIGNADYANQWKTNGFQTNWRPAPSSWGGQSWWNKLFADPNYANRNRDRWVQLRKGLFSISNLFGFIDETADYLDGPRQRNYQRWPVIGVYVWPNFFVGNTYQEEVDWMKNWLAARIDWLDGQWNTLIADFTAPTSAMIGESVTFTDTSFGGPDIWSWNFGAGTGSVSSDKNPTNIFTLGGTYTVTLSVSNLTTQFGWTSDTLAKTNYITVIPEPVILGFVFLVLLAAFRAMK